MRELVSVTAGGVHVGKMPGDGSCLFRAILHQMETVCLERVAEGGLTRLGSQEIRARIFIQRLGLVANCYDGSETIQAFANCFVPSSYS